MKTSSKLALYSGIISVCTLSTAHSALSSISTLNFDDPVYNNEGQVVSGSNFGVDFTGDGTIDLTERTGLISNDGLILGSAQPATPGSPGIDQAWDFFQMQGVHYTSSPVTIISDDGQGNVELDFSGWSVNWNGNEIGLGGSSWGSNPDGVAQMTCSTDCSDGDSFNIFYTATVTEGAFIGVRYRLGFDGNSLASAALAVEGAAIGPIEDLGVVATGTISSVPVPAAVWLFGTGLLALAGLARRRNQQQ